MGFVCLCGSSLWLCGARTPPSPAAVVPPLKPGKVAEFRAFYTQVPKVVLVARAHALPPQTVLWRVACRNVRMYYQQLRRRLRRALEERPDVTSQVTHRAPTVRTAAPPQALHRR